MAIVRSKQSRILEAMLGNDTTISIRAYSEKRIPDELVELSPHLLSLRDSDKVVVIMDPPVILAPKNKPREPAKKPPMIAKDENPAVEESSYQRAQQKPPVKRKES